MLDFVCFVLICFVFFDMSLKTKINILNTKKDEIQNCKNE